MYTLCLMHVHTYIHAYIMYIYIYTLQSLIESIQIMFNKKYKYYIIRNINIIINNF